MCVASDISRQKPLGGNTLVLKGSNVGEMQLWQMTLLAFRSSVNIYIYIYTQRNPARAKSTGCMHVSGYQLVV